MLEDGGIKFGRVGIMFRHRFTLINTDFATKTERHKEKSATPQQNYGSGLFGTGQAEDADPPCCKPASGGAEHRR